uniref:ABC transporter permease n=1 Tax=Roseihalotalea indica TaxID=2867963 RepID=A0AA49JJ54_9BACT|nr:ABC transporter permease [Tunicatimonas sp. TK19036]
MSNESKHIESPPSWANRFLRWYCRPELLEEIEGDLHEVFQRRIAAKGVRKAKTFYWLNVLMFFQPAYIRKRKNHTTNHTAMFKNYFKVSWRNLTRQKMYSAIKIGGLTLGVAACLLIALFIRHELSYDQQYPDADRIYRVVGVYNIQGETTKTTYFPAPLATVLPEDFPEVEAAGHFIGSELIGPKSKLVRRADKAENIYEEGFVYADQELLNVLQPHFLQGDLSQALTEPHTLVLSQSKADKYFPRENPLGKTLILNDDESQPYIIRGVFEDFPATSHFQYDFLLTLTDTESFTGDHTVWRRNIFHTYAKVRAGTNATQLASKLTEGIVKTYMVAGWKEGGLANAEDLAKNVSIELQPISDIHLYSKGIQDGFSHGDIRFVWLFGAIAGFILIIASINFINLSTAKATKRAKEVGLRKVVGSFRINLISQFLTESVLFSVVSFILAGLLAWLLLPYFNELAAKSLVFPWKEWWFLPLMAAVAVLVGILAGLYPSLYLSGFQPIKVLKGRLQSGGKNSRMRSTLVIFQFTTSIVLIIGTFIIYQQLDFILTKDVGFDKEQVLLIQGVDALDEQLPSFKNELLTLSGVEHVSISNFLPVTGTMRSGTSFWKTGREETDSPLDGQLWQVDPDYISTMGMELIAGRNFNSEIASDSQAVVINQTMARELGMDDPVGQEITGGGWPAMPVIGVVKDFHFEPLTEDIKPLSLSMGRGGSVASVKVNTSDISEAIAAITAVWERFSPNEPFQYSFLDQSYARMYSDVQRMGRIFTSFAVLAIIIACLGLFALSAFMIEQRRKEISVRLILGASLSQVFRLLTQSYLALVLISLLIATPIAWYLMQRWLEDYAYRIPIRWDVFLLAGLIGVVIAVLTISYQSIRATLINPVDNLRNE